MPSPSLQPRVRPLGPAAIVARPRRHRHSSYHRHRPFHGRLSASPCSPHPEPVCAFSSSKPSTYARSQALPCSGHRWTRRRRLCRPPPAEPRPMFDARCRGRSNAPSHASSRRMWRIFGKTRAHPLCFWPLALRRRCATMPVPLSRAPHVRPLDLALISH